MHAFEEAFEAARASKAVTKKDDKEAKQKNENDE